METETVAKPPSVPAPRGFARLSPERLKEISSRGGRSSHAKGTAHRYTKEEAVINGRKGGAVTASKTRKVSAVPTPAAIVANA